MMPRNLHQTRTGTGPGWFFRALWWLLPLGLAWAGPASLWAAQKGVIVLNMTTNYYSTHHTATTVLLPWIKTIERESGGRVRIIYHEPNILCPDAEVFRAIERGTVDIGGAMVSRSGPRFLLALALEQPLLINSAECGSQASWDLFNNFEEIRAEFQRVKPLWTWVSAPYQLHTRAKPVNGLTDLKGLTVMVWAPNIGELLRALGAQPFFGAPTDSRLALERGMVDGVLCPIPPLASHQIQDLVSHTALTNLLVTEFVMAMNLDVWNSLPPDIQAIFEAHSGLEMAERCGRSLDEADLEAIERMKTQGHKFTVWSPADRAAMETAVAPLSVRWATRLEAQGRRQARDILSRARQLRALCQPPRDVSERSPEQAEYSPVQP